MPHLTKRFARQLAVTISLSLLALPGATLAQPDAASTDRPGDLGRRYAATASRIIAAARDGNDAYKKLIEICDDIGPRPSGSAALQQAIDWAVAALKRDGQENVRTDPVMVPHWTRGQESLALVKPRPEPLPMLGLGGSVGTPADGITAPVLIVRSKDELDALPDERIKGRIVLFNVPMTLDDARWGGGYGPAVRYRYSAARWAAERGAVAALVRSVGPSGLRTPHTGGMSYQGMENKIPTAAITLEDAERFQRYQDREIEIVVTLKMEAKLDDELKPSANVLAELRGSEKPDEIVVIGGHIDSWDVGTSAHDDAAGCVIAMEALNLLRKLDLRPRRTIRVVLWTNEENGMRGAWNYIDAHADELDRHAAAIESDSGAFGLLGYGVDLRNPKREEEAAGSIEQIAGLLAQLGKLETRRGHSGADISPMREHQVPLLGLQGDMTQYFVIHHTQADTVDKIDPKDLTDHVAAMAVTAYILADMPGRLAEPDWRETPAASR